MTMSICMQMLFRGSGVPSCQSTEEAQASLDWGSASPNAQPAEAVAPATAAEPARGSAKRKRRASGGAAGGGLGVAEPAPSPAEALAPPVGAEAELAPAQRARNAPETLPGDPAEQSAQVAEALKVIAQVARSSGVMSLWLSGGQCLQPQCTLLYLLSALATLVHRQRRALGRSGMYRERCKCVVQVTRTLAAFTPAWAAARRGGCTCGYCWHRAFADATLASDLARAPRRCACARPWTDASTSAQPRWARRPHACTD